MMKKGEEEKKCYLRRKVSGYQYFNKFSRFDDNLLLRHTLTWPRLKNNFLKSLSKGKLLEINVCGRERDEIMSLL